MDGFPLKVGLVLPDWGEHSWLVVGLVFWVIFVYYIGMKSHILSRACREPCFFFTTGTNEHDAQVNDSSALTSVNTVATFFLTG